MYRAVLDGPGGFTKEVAIKLLRDDDVPEQALKRFRDEARILGLVRDRAIVNVDPPTRLAGRWAVVMEYVDGVSLQRLTALGPLPPSVAAEIVQEVARVLDKVFRMLGPNGEPLRILHRDIKPANIQVTPDGEVKVLDFGIARADFGGREATTTAYVGGTRGYIAPERLEGQDSPAGDVYSLGVTLHLLVTGERPTRRVVLGLDPPDDSLLEPEARALLALATAMRDVEPGQRPPARVVEEALAAIVRRSEGPSLRAWAERNVPRAVASRSADEMVGSVLSETLAAGVSSADRIAGGREIVEQGQSTGEPRSAPVKPIRVLATGVATGAVLLVGTVLGLSTAGLGFALFTDVWSGPPEVAEAAPVAVVDEVPEPEPIPVPPPAPEPTPEPAPVPPPRAPPKPVVPVPEPVVEVVPEPAPEAPEATSTTLLLTFSSVPLGADVLIDGRFVGQTPILDLAVTPGPHQVKMVSDADTLIRNIDVGRRNPLRYVWKGGETWELHY